MNILSIDCSAGLYVALMSGKKMLTSFSDQTKLQSPELLKTIDNLLKQAGINTSELDAIAVCVGPGSFTGIRVAISTAKGIGYALNAKMIEFDSFSCAGKISEQDNTAIILEGFGQNYYYKIIKGGKQYSGCDTIENILKLAGSAKLVTTSRQVAEKLSIFYTDYDIKYVIDKKIKDGDFLLINQISPLYLRKSQAEIEREKRCK